MKWKLFPLGVDDPKARQHLLQSLRIGAQEHALTRGLLSRFTRLSGSFMAIALESLDLDRLTDYQYDGLYAGRPLSEVVGTQRIPMMERPGAGLIQFIEQYLRTSQTAIVLFELLLDSRTNYLTHWRPRESRALFYKEDVYHFLTADDASFDAIEAAIRTSMDLRGVGVCSSCSSVPQFAITSDAFFDEIADNTAHIFAAAFDHGGYLIWSPVK